MKENARVDVDALLDELKATQAEGEFSSTEEFTKDFFERADKLTVSSRTQIPLRRKLQWATSIAATFLMVVGGLLLVDKRPEEAIVQDIVAEAKAEQPEVVAEAPEVLEDVLVCEPEVVMAAPAPRALAKRSVMRANLAVSAERSGFAAEADMLQPQVSFDTEEYKSVEANAFLSAKEQSLSTFGADVDTASYANVRRFLTRQNRLPPKDAVRIEEFVNTFTYDYAAPTAGEKFGTTFEMTDCPWAEGHKLLLIGLQAKKTELDQLPQSNFVFLVDDSGSMHDSMEMVIQAMTMLTNQLRAGDTVSLVTYGGGVRILLDGAKATDKTAIVTALQKLKAGGYTPGGSGIIEAYKLAAKHFIKGGNNRIVLVTDGDFNVGASSESDLVTMIEEKRKSEVYLSVFGVGAGNYKDNKLKMLANKGNGNYTYLDNLREAKNAMVNEYSGGMFALARDVKLQVEFNPGKVYAYRLLGYELRKLENRDFRDDTKDAGEVGVGHQVTALYELVMADAPAETKAKVLPAEQELKYQTAQTTPSEDILTFRLRYREIEGDAPADEKEFVLDAVPPASNNIAWAACAAEFALLLQDSPYKGSADYEVLRKRAIHLLGDDNDGGRAEFLTLLRAAADYTP